MNDISDDELNVRIGTCLFSIPRKNIMEYPDTTLAKALTEDAKGRELTFKRSVLCFNVIRDFYVCGKLHMPSSVCPNAFKEELEFWNIPDAKIELCCALRYQTYLEDIKNVEKFRQRESRSVDTNIKPQSRKHKIWKVLDNQSKSIFNTVYNILSTALVLCSIVIMTINMENNQTGESGLNTAIQQNVSEPLQQQDSPNKPVEDKPIETLCLKALTYEEGEQLFLMERICIKDCSRIEKPNESICGPQNKCTTEVWESHIGHITLYEICKECRPLFFPEITTPIMIDLQVNEKNEKVSTHKNISETLMNNTESLGTGIEMKEIPMEKVLTFIDKYIQKTNDYIPIKDILDFENIFIVLYTTEFILRFATCPSKVWFIASIPNILDFIALVASWTKIAIILAQSEFEKRWINVLMIGQMMRVFRLLRSIKHLKAFKVLTYAALKGCKDLLVIVLYVIVGIVIFGTLMFFVEPHETFPDVGQAVWWSIITMTTVGYGDVYPSTISGKLIACICALYGIVMLALTIPLFAQTFQTIYQFASLDDDNDENKNTKDESRKDYCTV